MDISLYTDGEQATAAVLNRPLQEIKTRLSGEEARTGNILLANSDWTGLISNAHGGCQYSENYKGVLVTGARSIYLDFSKIEIDPEREYTIRVRVRKIKNNDRFYCGVKTFDKDGNGLSTDEATSYNYGVASNKSQTAGRVYNYQGVFKGYNATDESSGNKFDPGGTHFAPMLLLNYGGDSDSECVIEMLEIKVQDMVDEMRFQKRISYGHYASTQTFYVDGDHDKFYPVIIPINNSFGGPKQFNITRTYSQTAPFEWHNSSSHKGGLELAWEDVSTTYSANLHHVRMTRHWTVYTRIFAGMQKIGGGAGWTVMYLRGGHASYQLNSDYDYDGYEKLSLEDITEFQDWITSSEEATTDTSVVSSLLTRNSRNKKKIYVLDEPVEVQSTDENGDPVEDENGDPVMESGITPAYRQYWKGESDNVWSYKYNLKSYFTLDEVNAADELLVGATYMKSLKDSGKDETDGAQYGLYIENSYYGTSYNLGGAR